MKRVILSLAAIALVLIVSCQSSESPKETQNPGSPTGGTGSGPTSGPPPTTNPAPTVSPAPSSAAIDDGTATITGVPVLPDLDVNAGDLLRVTLYDLEWNEIATDKDSDPRYAFTVDKGNHYILTADYAEGQSLGALTPTVPGDLDQDITIDSEVAMSLIIATERAHRNLLPGSLSRPLDDLLADANQAVSNLNAFYTDRNANRKADRVADAVHAMTLDFLNRFMPVYVDYLDEKTIRSYGGGLEGLRSLSQMVTSPLMPLNPHFVFTRYNYDGDVDFGMSDLETKRWDFMGADGMTPHVATGGNRVVFVKPTSTRITSINENMLGLYVRDFGTSPSSAQLITPYDMECWTPSWSPDQKKIAFAGRYIGNPSSTRPIVWKPLNIFVVDVETEAITQITFETGTVADRLDGCLNPVWSPDGASIAFDYSLGGQEETRLEAVEVNDTSSRRVLVNGGVDGIWRPGEARFSPDGSFIVFSANIEDEASVWDYELLMIASNHQPGERAIQLTDNTYDDTRPDWSYDGRFIIFASNWGGEPGHSISGDLNPFYVMNAYTGEIVADLGDFANAGAYWGARFCGTESVLITVDGVKKNNSGEAVVSGSDSRKSPSGNSDYSYYRETIPAANSIVDAYGAPAYNYGVTSWW
ncbi:MAG: hypothetical protein FJZ95_04775 [Chloroflexi bacterium]|nr:hypothetical protein [Chloroflexota bacterium]